MATKKTSEFKGKSAAELTKALAQMREEMRTMRFNGAGARSKDPHAGRKMRRDIARILTEMTAQAQSAAGAPRAVLAKKA
jgi:ribosomal protein L29